MANLTQEQIIYRYPLMTAKERVLVWAKAKGLLQKKAPRMITELKKMRSEWERDSIKTR